MSKRGAQTELSKEFGEVQGGREESKDDPPRQATAAQMAARKIKSLKSMKRPSSRVNKPLNTSNPFNSLGNNTSGGFTSQQPITNFSQPQQQNGNFHFGFSQATTAPQTNGFTNPASSSFPPATPHSQSHTFTPNTTSFSFTAGQNTPAPGNPPTFTNGLSSTNTNNSGFSGSIFNLPSSAPSFGQDRRNQNQLSQPSATAPQSQANSFAPTSASVSFTANQSKPAQANPFAITNGSNTANTFGQGNQDQNNPSEPPMAPRSQEQTYLPKFNSFSWAPNENFLAQINPFATLTGLDKPYNYGLISSEPLPDLLTSTSGFGQTEQTQLQPAEQSAAQENSATNLNGTSQPKNTLNTSNSLFQLPSSTSSFGQENQNQTKPSEPAAVQGTSTPNLNGAGASGSLFQMPSTSSFGIGNQAHAKPSESAIPRTSSSTNPASITYSSTSTFSLDYGKPRPKSQATSLPESSPSTQTLGEENRDQDKPSEQHGSSLTLPSQQSNSPFKALSPVPSFNQDIHAEKKPLEQSSSPFKAFSSASSFGQANQNQNPSEQSSSPFKAFSSASSFGQSKQNLEKSSDQSSSPFKAPSLTPSFGQASQSQKPLEQSNSPFKAFSSASNFGQSKQDQEKPSEQSSSFAKPPPSTLNFGQTNENQKKPSEQSNSLFKGFSSTPGFGQANQTQEKPSEQSSLFAKPASSTPSLGQTDQDQNKSLTQPATQKTPFATSQGMTSSDQNKPSFSGSFSGPSSTTTLGFGKTSSEPQAPRMDSTSSPRIAPASTYKSNTSSKERMTALNDALREHLQEQPVTADWSEIMNTYLKQVKAINGSSAPSQPAAETSTPTLGFLSAPTTSDPPVTSSEKTTKLFQSSGPAESSFSFLGASSKRKAAEDLSQNESPGLFGAKKLKSQELSSTPTPKVNDESEIMSETSGIMKSVVDNEMPGDQTPEHQSTMSVDSNYSLFHSLFGSSPRSRSPSPDVPNATVHANPFFAPEKENVPPVVSSDEAQSQPQPSFFNQKPTTQGSAFSTSPASPEVQKKAPESLPSKGSERIPPSGVSPASMVGTKKSAEAEKPTRNSESSLTTGPPKSIFSAPKPFGTFGEQAKSAEVGKPVRDPDSPLTTGPSKSIFSGFKSLGAGSTGNFMSQFAEQAKKNDEAEKQKRKIEDMDSDDDEEEWERRDNEEQERKRARLTKGGGKKLKFAADGTWIWEDSNETAPTEPAKSTESPGSMESAKPTESSKPLPKPAAPGLSTPQPLRPSNISIFNHPQTARADLSTNNIFGHLAKNDNSDQQDDKDDSDDETSESAARKGERTISKAAPVAPSTAGKSLFDRVTPSTDDQSIKTGPGKRFELEKTQEPQKSKESVITSDEVPSPAKQSVFGFEKNKPAFGSAKPNLSETQLTSNIFGQKTNDSQQNPSSTPSKSSLFGFDKNQNAVGDFTWTEGTPVKFASSTAAHPSLQFTAPTPTRPSEESADALSDPKASTDNDATPSKRRKPAFGLDGASDTPIFGLDGTSDPPPFGLDGTSDTKGKGAHVGFNFGPASSSSSKFGGSLFPPSAVSSPFASSSGGPVSRSSTPGLTTDGEGSVATSTAGDDDTTTTTTATEAQQDDLSDLLESEKLAEDVLVEVKAKVMEYKKADAKTKDAGWHNRGQGPLRVLRNKESGVVRILMRSSPAGQLVINSRLVLGVEYKRVKPKTAQITVVNAEGGLTSLIVRVASDENVDKLVTTCEENKSHD